MGRIDEAVAVLVDQEGAPTLFRWREKDYQVSSRPVRWFTKAEWWVGERAHRGIGSGAAEVEIWRFSISGNETRKSIELLHNTMTGNWFVLQIF